MMKVKEITVNSKRTIKLLDEYMSFEVSYTADIEDGDNVNDSTKVIYDQINDIIDNQCNEAIKMKMQGVSSPNT